MSLRLLSTTLLITTLLGCQNTYKQGSSSEWDFDHQLQYKQEQLSQGRFSIEVVSNGKVPFNRLATFLLRQSYRLCGAYGFKLEVINGVGGFDDRRVSPSYVQPNLLAELECPEK